MLRLVKPDLNYKDKCISYIDELYKYNSNINGVGKLDKYLKESTYEKWLDFLNYKENEKQEKDKVNSSEYLLVDSSNNLIGMVNIRHFLNEKYKEIGGHIGYSIRPTMRRRGYNKINLYLALVKCQELKIEKALITCDDDNTGSYKTIEALEGTLENKIESEGRIIRRYLIDVNNSIDKYKEVYGGNKNVF